MRSMVIRTVLGAIAGYAAIFLWTVLAFTTWWYLLGQERAFDPGTTDVSLAWLAGTLPLNLVGAMIGGWVAARIGGPVAASRAVILLALLILVFGLWFAITLSTGSAPAPPTAPDMGPFEAAAAAVQPVWVSWFLPVLGAFGVGIGGMLALRRTTDVAPAGS